MWKQLLIATFWVLVVAFIVPKLIHGQSLDSNPAPIGANPRILNFDKVLSGTDKMVFISPPPLKQWTILAASVSIERPVEGVTFHAWLEDAGPLGFQPFRNAAGEMVGCALCLTIIQASAAHHTFFPIVGGYNHAGLHGSPSLTLLWPSRLALAMTPAHGTGCPPNSCLPESMKLYIRIRVIESGAS